MAWRRIPANTSQPPEPAMRILGTLIALVLAACLSAADTPGIVHIKSAKEFDAFIAASKDAKGVVVVDFHAEWCGPCKLLGPELDALVKANPGKLAVLKVDVDQNPELATRFNVSSIPVVVKMAGGKEAARQVGFGGKEKLAAFVGLK
jgi:thioredoxin 1